MSCCPFPYTLVFSLIFISDASGIVKLLLLLFIINNRWSLVKIVMVHSSQDGKVHIFTIKTSKGVCNRPVGKLLHLVQDQEKSKNRVVLAGGMMAPECTVLKRSSCFPFVYNNY